MSSNNRGTNIKRPSGLWLLIMFMATVIAVVSFSSLLSPPPSPEKLRMLGSSFSGYSTFRYPVFEDKLKEVEIELSYENESDMQEMIGRFNRGEADLIAMTLDQFLRQKPDGKIVGLIDRSVGADGAVLNTKKYPSVTSLDKLRSLVEEEKIQGRRLKVVYAVGSPSEFFFVVLIKNSYHALNISFEELKASDDRDAWKRLQVDQDVALAILREPYLTIAQQQGYKKVYFPTQEEPTRIIDVIVASNRLLRNQPETVSQFLKAYYDYIIPLILDEFDRSESEQSLMQYQMFFDSELSLERAKDIGKNIHFFTAVEADYWLTSGKLKQQIEVIANLLSQAGKLDRKPQNPQDLFAAQYIADAVAETNEFCAKLSNVPQFQEFKERICELTPHSQDEGKND